MLRRHKPYTRHRISASARRGAATLDFVLVLGVILPIAAVVIGMGSRIMQLVYEMLAVFLAWPFM